MRTIAGENTLVELVEVSLDGQNAPARMLDMDITHAWPTLSPSSRRVFV